MVAGRMSNMSNDTAQDLSDQNRELRETIILINKSRSRFAEQNRRPLALL
jgi:hypothetical protein